jgi:nitrogen fixation protein NifX
MTPLERQLRVIESDPEPEILRVAFATTDREYVNQHFGSARAFVIYAVNERRARVVSICEFTDMADDDGDEKLGPRIDQLRDCAAVYCRACGASAVRQLLMHGIQPVRVTDDASISDLLEALQEELRAGPSSWLAKAIRRQAPGAGRFDSMEADGWDE